MAYQRAGLSRYLAPDAFTSQPYGSRLSAAQYYLFDRELHPLVSQGQFPRGMMTRIDVFPAVPTAPPPAPTDLTDVAVTPTRVALPGRTRIPVRTVSQ